MSEETTAKATTLDDVLGAVTKVDKRIDALDNKFDSLDRRVTSLEKQPMLKTRIVHQEKHADGSFGPMTDKAPAKAGSNKPPSPPKVVRRDDPSAAGEDEAIKAGAWEKVVKTSRCYKVGVTKTRNRDSWKLKLYLRGQRRPATLIGWDGTAELIAFMGEVWPEICDDFFSESKFGEEDQGKGDPVEFQFDERIGFLVDWFRTAPDHRGHTYINVEGVYPLAETE